MYDDTIYLGCISLFFVFSLFCKLLVMCHSHCYYFTFVCFSLYPYLEELNKCAFCSFRINNKMLNKTTFNSDLYGFLLYIFFLISLPQGAPTCRPMVT